MAYISACYELALIMLALIEERIGRGVGDAEVVHPLLLSHLPEVKLVHGGKK